MTGNVLGIREKEQERRILAMGNLDEKAVGGVGSPDLGAFRILIAMSVFCFFIVAAFSRMLPKSWRPLYLGHANESCLQEARRTAHTVIPYAFMR